MTHENMPGVLTELLLLAGQILLENGAETYRVEYTVSSMFHALGGCGNIHVVSLGTQLTVDIYDGAHHTAVRRIRRRGVNLEKFSRVNDISRKISEGALTGEQALILLRELDAKNTGSRIKQLCAAAVLVSGMFVFMIGGGIFEAVIAVIGCLIVQAYWIYIKKPASLVFVAHITSGFLLTLLAAAGTLIWNLSFERILFGAMLPLFPGVAMILAIRDTVNGDLTSGVARGVEAVLTAAGLALGASLGLMCVSFFREFSSDLHMVIMTDVQYAVFALLISLGAGLVLHARFKSIIAGALIGGIVYAVFLLCGGTVAGVFVASLTLAALSETAARILKVPSTLFLITGIFPLVPGAGIYKTAAQILQSSVAAASATGNRTVAELLFMVAGIAIVSAIFQRTS